ncbi:MAG: thiamine pyrophosphate-dependent enzyme [Candidatus Saliniplasma sp.]
MAHDYESDVWVDWCKGCGNFGIISSMYKAFKELDLSKKNTVVVSGIGCSGKIPHYIEVSGVHTLHGRAIPFASGIKISNPELDVIVNGGDGDLLGIGAGHFVALGRRNIDITILLHDNRVYGLTKGQAAPTLDRDVKTKALLKPNIQDPVEPLKLALTCGFTYVARGSALDPNQLKRLIIEGIEHEGTAFIDILQPCVTYNDIHTWDYIKENVERLDEDYDPKISDDEDKINQVFKMLNDKEKIYTGVFLKDEDKSTFEERITNMMHDYSKSPPAKQEIGRIMDQHDMEDLFERYLIERV